jgi:hypothetical protein
MSSTTTTIEIPRLPGERAERHEARVLYLTMGADRSLDAVRQKLGKSKELIERWSSADGWGEQARNYDSTLATLAAQAHTVEYQRAIEQQRAEASKIGGELIATGRTLIGEVVRRRDALEYKPSDLAVAVKAILAGFDLRAHALDLDKLLPALLGEGRDDA